MKDNDEIRIVARRTEKDEITVYCEDWSSSKTLNDGDCVCCEGEKALVELTCFNNSPDVPSYLKDIIPIWY